MKFRHLVFAKIRGFTMIELLVVIAIVAILATVAVPALQGTVRDFRQRSALSLLISDLNQARGEAIKRNSRVLLCVRNANGTGCAGSTNWLSGWVVCTTDQVTSTVCDAASAASPNPFIVRPALDTSLTLAADAASVALSSIRFNANSSQGAGISAATFTLGGTWSGAAANTVTVAVTGNISRH